MVALIEDLSNATLVHRCGNRAKGAQLPLE